MTLIVTVIVNSVTLHTKGITLIEKVICFFLLVFFFTFFIMGPNALMTNLQENNIFTEMAHWADSV